MALMERVATLLRANLLELMARAEDPERMLRQVVLDMENQLLQLKTQVAMALADGYLIEKKAREQEDSASTWHREALLAVGKHDDDAARAALERALNHENLFAAYRAQLAEQRAESEARRATYTKLQAKLAESKVQCDILIAEHRRGRSASHAAEARLAGESAKPGALLDAALSRIGGNAGSGEGRTTDGVDATFSEASLKARFATLQEHRFATLQEDRVEQLLLDLKRRSPGVLATE